MFPRYKIFNFSCFSSNSYCFIFVYALAVICLSNFCLCEDCKHINDCKCVFNNGSIIDLSSLANKDNKPVWENVKPSLKNDTYTYFYNPCYKFSLGNEGECKNVEVCQKSATGEYYNVGSEVFLQWNNRNHTLSFVYHTSTLTQRTTNVALVCSPDAKKPKFEVKGEIKSELYEMTLTTRCACADLCSEQHLSGGSVLVILFLIFVSLYLILGIIHSSLTRGAHGWELLPHYEFWMDFPLLVRDGCVFVMSGCKPETAYERI